MNTKSGERDVAEKAPDKRWVVRAFLHGEELPAEMLRKPNALAPLRDKPVTVYYGDFETA